MIIYDHHYDILCACVRFIERDERMEKKQKMDIFCEEFILPIPLLIGQQLSQIQMLDENHRKKGMNVFAASLTGVKETEIHFKRVKNLVSFCIFCIFVTL